MSRGPGRVERSVEALFCENPRRSFTGEEIAHACFPGVNRLEKKHRVSALRAVSKIAPKLHWNRSFISGGTGSVVYYNLLDLRSFALGRTRAHEHGDPIVSRYPLNAIEFRRRENEWRKAQGLAEIPDHRVVYRSGVLDEERALLMLLGEDIGTEWRSKRDESKWVRVDGAYPLAVEANKMEVKGQDATATWGEYNKRVKITVYMPHSIVGEIHPDFLAA